MTLVAGVDIGSTTAKALVFSDRVEGHSILLTGVDPKSAGEKALNLALEDANYKRNDLEYVVATGYGRISAPFANKTVTEITCHAKGAHYLIPDVSTVIDIGGQDSKAIKIDERGNVIDFIINDKCAAGTGRFLEFISEYVLNVPIEELGKISLNATKECKISSTCTVFAQTEVVSLLADGEKPENIVAGLHYAVASRIGSLAKHIGASEPLILTGGVAKNIGVKKSLENYLNLKTTQIPNNFDSQLVGALGAALIARGTLNPK
ncbi:MAG: acyl-CoA dehydratase activase [Candidatus Hydrothermarchaeota archaeon]